jgi:hypothetical protein
LFYPVPRKDVAIPFLVNGSMQPDSGEPAFTDIFQRPGECPEKMQQGIITARVEYKAVYDGGDTRLI